MNHWSVIEYVNNPFTIHLTFLLGLHGVVLIFFMLLLIPFRVNRLLLSTVKTALPHFSRMIGSADTDSAILTAYCTASKLPN